MATDKMDNNWGVTLMLTDKRKWNKNLMISGYDLNKNEEFDVLNKLVISDTKKKLCWPMFVLMDLAQTCMLWPIQKVFLMV